MSTPLASYLRTLMGDRTLREVAEIGISRSALHQILQGITTQPTPDSLARIARYFGNSEMERASLYADLMGLAGYLDPLFPAAHALTADGNFDTLATEWVDTLEREAQTSAAREFARRLRTLYRQDPTQFALYYNAAQTLARLRGERAG